jgi:hypothetical protein
MSRPLLLKPWSENPDIGRMDAKDDRTSGLRTDARWRLAVLLVLLGLSILAALGTRTGLFNPTGGTKEALGYFAKGCPGYEAPEVTSTSTAHLAKLSDILSRLIGTRYGQPYEKGIVTSDHVWSDNSPMPLSSTGTSATPAGYEIRWWVQRRNDIVADVFEFATSQQANAFLTRAASARCRHDGVARRAPFPRLAYNLLWVNPDNAREQDVFFASRRRVYRVVDVRATQRHPVRPRRYEQEIGTLTVDILACKLPGANCQVPISRPSIA